MITRNLTAEDAEKVYDAFKSVAVARNQENAPDYGFFEYPLTKDDFTARLYDSRLSLVMEEKRSLIAYIIAYPFYEIKDIDTKQDLVLPKLNVNSQAVYIDQFFMKPGFPLFMAGRFIDIWTNHAMGYQIPGTVCAIPQKPWKNIASTRFAVCRGFSRKGSVNDKGIEFGIFAKPFWELGLSASELNLEILKN